MLRSALLGLALCAACGGDKATEPTPIEVQGSWSGTITGTSGGTGQLALTLTEASGAVTGSGTITTSTVGIAVSGTGTYVAPTVSLTLHAQGFEDMNLTATVGETTMTGTLNGSGFNNSAISLSRQ